MLITFVRVTVDCRHLLKYCDLLNCVRYNNFILELVTILKFTAHAEFCMLECLA